VNEKEQLEKGLEEEEKKTFYVMSFINMYCRHTHTHMDIYIEREN
jgi:hypothetical protein